MLPVTDSLALLLDANAEICDVVTYVLVGSMQNEVDDRTHPFQARGEIVHSRPYCCRICDDDDVRREWEMRYSNRLKAIMRQDWDE